MGMASERAAGVSWHLATPRHPAYTAMHQTVLDGRLHQLKLLLLQHRDAIDSADMYGRTPLILCAIIGHHERGLRMADSLLHAGALLHAHDLLGRTAIFYAVINNNERLVRRLLREDVTCLRDADADGNTVLNHAAVAGNPRIVKLLVDTLVKFNMPVDHKNAAGYTALLLACRFANYVAAFIIFMYGDASCAVRDGEFNRTPAQWIVESTGARDLSPRPTPYVRELTVHGIAPDGTFVLSENSESFRDLIEPRRSHTMLPSFNREFELASFYRCGRLGPGCKHVHHVYDPFIVPAFDPIPRTRFYLMSTTVLRNTCA